MQVTACGQRLKGVVLLSGPDPWWAHCWCPRLRPVRGRSWAQHDSLPRLVPPPRVLVRAARHGPPS
eukprot:9878890-Alexandrium_andersonii.AAC.1